LLLASCTHTVEEFHQIDLNSYLQPPKAPIKVRDTDANLPILFEKIYKNTLNKRIPNLPLINIKGDSIMLYDILHQKSILIFSDHYCSYGMEGMCHDFPKTMEKVKKDHPEAAIQSIGILIKAVEADSDPKRFHAAAEEINALYSNYFYIMDDKTAAKLNIFANPTKYYINDSRIKTHLGMGINNIENY